MEVVVVESPAKAKTINKYLGSRYRVLASYGHIRDLPAKDGSVRPDADFDMSWEVDGRAEKHLKAIAAALKGADGLILATDPDREGEAISWHVCEVLNQRKALKGVGVKRVVFHEITKDAVTEAIRNPREIDHKMVDAYLARRALDYLVGFTLSPVLWRKLPGARSAGRVQSVALRLICEREAEIEAFKPREYWTVEADFRTRADKTLRARLTHLDGRKLDQFDLPDAASARTAVAEIARHGYSVAEVERKLVRRRAAPPFTTSTLQQEASRKLGFSATRTMRVAQKLYEGIELDGETVGLITYMRTDSLNLSGEAIAATRGLIGRLYGADYVPGEPNFYRNKAKNAQEAHEAIRPTDVTRRPEDVARFLDADERRLYELVWKRTVACQMENAVFDQVAVDIASGHRKIVFRATGSVVKFDGYLRVYQEDSDEPAADDEDGRVLPDVAKGDPLAAGAAEPLQHFTKPPPRYTEASLVRRLEELGIGRPSTYASILSVLQERNYVRLEKRQFIPEDRGRLVTAFLDNFFNRYVQYNFTAELEDQLDDISNGKIDWKAVLRAFWQAFSASVEGTRELRVSDVLDTLDRELGPHFFSATGAADPRRCPSCETGRLGIKLGRHGAFIGCSNYPGCTYTRPLAVEDAAGEGAGLALPKDLGRDPDGHPVSLRKGPYGLYVQRGDGTDKEVLKRASLLKGMEPDALTLETACALLSLPRAIGAHPETTLPIIAGVGRFGPYLKHGDKFVSLGAGDDVLTIGLNRAVAVIAEAASRPPRGRAMRAEVIRIVGAHPADGKPVALHKGRYGPYVSHGGVNVTLPKDMAEGALTLDEALALLAERAAKGKPARGGRGRAGAVKPKAAAAAETAPAAKPAKPKKAAAKAKPRAAAPKGRKIARTGT
ncbi:MAG: type I DNA topoisomerase [Alphaproteobacteria bacterium]|nr:type I DNA topoisomerase [Alphaproteobacteria bacterium]